MSKRSHFLFNKNYSYILLLPNVLSSYVNFSSLWKTVCIHTLLYGHKLPPFFKNLLGKPQHKMNTTFSKMCIFTYRAFLTLNLYQQIFFDIALEIPWLFAGLCISFGVTTDIHFHLFTSLPQLKKNPSGRYKLTSNL